MNDKPHVVNAGLVALILTAIYIPAITITAELVPPLKSWLAATYGHHWVGKGIIMMIFYAVVFLILLFIYKVQGKQLSSKLISSSATVALISSIVIMVFFLYEYLIH